MIKRNSIQTDMFDVTRVPSSSHPPVVGQSSPADEDELVEEKENQTQFILNECAMKWPGIAVMQKKASTDWTIPSLKARIDELKAEHRKQLARCVKYSMIKEYELLDQFYVMSDEIEPWGSPDVIADIRSSHRMQSYIEESKRNDFLIKLRHIHIEALTPLYRKLKELQNIEERARQHRAKLFPKSTQAWRDMDTKDAKLAIARFLMLDKKQQEDQLNRNKIWKESKTAVDNLCLEHENNVVFAQEIKTFLKENETTDPRKKVQ